MFSFDDRKFSPNNEKLSTRSERGEIFTLKSQELEMLRKKKRRRSLRYLLVTPCQKLPKYFLT